MSTPAIDPSISIDVGGTNYTVSLRELTGRDARDFRAVTGFSLLQAMARSDLDLDVGAGVVWLIRRRTEPRLTYDAVLDSVNYDNYFADTAVAEADGQSGNGQAPDGDLDPEG